MKTRQQHIFYCSILKTEGTFPIQDKTRVPSHLSYLLALTFNFFLSFLG
jgi:hypothetical protein